MVCHTDQRLWSVWQEKPFSLFYKVGRIRRIAYEGNSLRFVQVPTGTNAVLSKKHNTNHYVLIFFRLHILMPPQLKYSLAAWL